MAVGHLAVVFMELGIMLPRNKAALFWTSFLSVPSFREQIDEHLFIPFSNKLVDVELFLL